MDDLFFYSSKIIWMLIAPDSLFLILLILSLLLLIFNQRGKGLILLGILSFSLLLLSVFPIGNWLLYPLETRFEHNPVLPQNIDGIIVLGGSVLPQTSEEWQQLETNGFHERLSTFISLARQYPQAQLIFSGGNASFDLSQPSEAEIVRHYFLNEGISEERLRLEGNSRNTAENVRRSRRIIKPQTGENWILITTAFHMPRAVGLFCHNNWPVIAYPVDHKTIPSELYEFKYNLMGHANNLMLGSHEWLGLLAYYVSGKIDHPFPHSC